ncbi:MAG TPA: histidine kinase dimerization/phospho-acceptor domain-containing protein [Candidatus Dormibacteraeota bacterium]|nr:histidine kinase dimerization/phospho-acceptor domain-containing protein [Candidatus Dormibacteraeota bacterium]HEV2476705.1 histidine kinase dimerization/phospho-acceptor domain-containing protein [Candidatus Dormibacteraeota bacterium]
MGRWFSRQPLVRFGVIALVPVLVLGVVLARALNSDVQQRFLDTARSSAAILTQVGIQPLFTEQDINNGLTPNLVPQIDAKLQGAAVSTEVDRLKVWNRQGTIVYSDNHGLIGKSFPIDDDLNNALHGQSSASITTGQDSENAGDTLSGPLIQVYVPLTFKGDDVPSGAFELYLPYAPVQAAIDNESRQLYILLAAGLTLFYISMFPIVFLAIRWQRQAEAAAMANLATLERLNKLKSDFLVRISHQFRTAMVGIEGFTELMRDSDHLDLEEVKAFARDIHDDAERLDHAFEKMVEIDQADSSAGPVDVNELTAKTARRETAQTR